MAREFRKNPEYKEVQVILLKDINSGKAGVDYRSEDGKSIWFPVDGFLKKPVDAKKLFLKLKDFEKKLSSGQHKLDSDITHSNCPGY